MLLINASLLLKARWRSTPVNCKRNKKKSTSSFAPHFLPWKAFSTTAIC